jgi:hypothetical protein
MNKKISMLACCGAKVRPFWLLAEITIFATTSKQHITFNSTIMDSMERETVKKESLFFNERSLHALQRAGYWGRFISVIGIISAFLTITGGLFMFLAGSLTSDTGIEVPIPLPLMGALYLVSGLVTLISAIYLWQFAAKTELAIQIENSDLLADGLHKLMAMMRLLALAVIISIGLVILGLLAFALLSLLSL